MELQELIKKFKHANKISFAKAHAIKLLEQDSQTAAPKGSVQSREVTLEILGEEYFKLITSQKRIDLIAELKQNIDKLDVQTARECLIAERELNKIIKIPVQEYVEYSLLLNRAQQAWEEAKAKNDYEIFKPLLSKIIKANIKNAGYINDKLSPYNALLGEYEYGFTTKDYDAYFEQLKGSIVPTIAAIACKPKPDTSYFDQKFSIEIQKQLSNRIMEIMGIDKTYCSIAESAHPFTNSFSKYDVRITTHYYDDMLASSLYSVIHEGGHALYELNIGDKLQYGPLANACSLGFHESQSRFYENIIGRSQEFMHLLLPILSDLFPEQSKGLSEEYLYKALNVVKPSLVRIEADELTYSLHVLVRYEIEKLLIQGSLNADDAPYYWNNLYKEYLGVDVTSNSSGILQDIHWAGGSFGYFPTYSIGSAYSAQILNTINNDFSVRKAIYENNIPKITKWLANNIHIHGLLYDPRDALLKCCAEEFIPTYYFDYLNNKFKTIYNI